MTSADLFGSANRSPESQRLSRSVLVLEAIGAADAVRLLDELARAHRAPL